MRFDDNAAVLVNSKKEMIGNRIGGVVAAELRSRGWGKIVSLGESLVSAEGWVEMLLDCLGGFSAHLSCCFADFLSFRSSQGRMKGLMGRLSGWGGAQKGNLITTCSIRSPERLAKGSKALQRASSGCEGRREAKEHLSSEG